MADLTLGERLERTETRLRNLEACMDKVVTEVAKAKAMVTEVVKATNRHGCGAKAIPAMKAMNRRLWREVQQEAVHEGVQDPALREVQQEAIHEGVQDPAQGRKGRNGRVVEAFFPTAPRRCRCD